MSHKKGICHYFLYCAQGGAFGLLNAAWLREIERHTLIPIAHMASVVAGASVGAIHAAALTLRDTDHPESPAYSAADYYEIFKADLPRFLPHDPWFYPRQVLRTPIHLAAQYMSRQVPWLFGSNEQGAPYKTHYSTDYPENRLKSLFNGARVSDALTGLGISAHRLYPYPSTACDFLHLPEGFDTEKFYHTYHPGSSEEEQAPLRALSDTPLHQAVMASIVCPTIFKSYEIPDHGIFTDMGGVNNPAGMIAALRASLPPEDDIHFIWLGTASLDRRIDPSHYNRSSFLSTITPMTDMANMHVSSQCLPNIRRAIGTHNVTILEAHTAEDRDILDTSPKGIAALEELAERTLLLQKTQFERIAIKMGADYLRTAQAKPDTAFIRPPLSSQSSPGKPPLPPFSQRSPAFSFPGDGACCPLPQHSNRPPCPAMA